MVRWARHVAHVEEVTNAYKIFDGKSEGRRALGEPRRR
jgi:hypothetical protein